MDELSARQRARVQHMTRTTLQYSHDYFDYFHANVRYPGVRARRAAFSAMAIPRWRTQRRPDPALNVSRPLGPRIRDRWPGEDFSRNRRTDDGAGRVIDPDVQARLLALGGIEVGRILGAGSQGLAIAIRQNGRDLVVKYATGVQTMVIEMWAMREMVGARHIVQVSCSCPGVLGEAVCVK